MKTEIDEIRVKNGEIKRLIGTEHTMTVDQLVGRFNYLEKEVERKEKVLTSYNELIERIGDSVYDYYKW